MLLNSLRRDWPTWFRQVPAYGIGGVAAFWLIERVAGFCSDVSSRFSQGRFLLWRFQYLLAGADSFGDTDAAEGCLPD